MLIIEIAVGAHGLSAKKTIPIDTPDHQANSNIPKVAAG